MTDNRDLYVAARTVIDRVWRSHVEAQSEDKEREIGWHKNRAKDSLDEIRVQERKTPTLGLGAISVGGAG